MSLPSLPSGRGPETGAVVAAGDPPDQRARDRIARELDANLMVEAGAGSGKTSELVRRMTALIEHDVPADQIAAVTFTRKAAAELRQRFQEALERKAAKASPGGRAAQKAARRALQDLDRTFVGTIHAFCVRLLRQRPLDAGLDPGFREVQEAEGTRMEEQAWADFLERLAKDGDPRLARLEKLGIPPARLWDAFRRMVEHPDVDFGSPEAAGPPAPLEPWFEDGGRPLPAEVEEARTDLDALLARAERLMPKSEPEDGWDDLAKKARALLALRQLRDWDRPADFFDALSAVHDRKLRPTQKRWPDGGAAKALGQDFAAFAAADGKAGRLLASWWAHRYPAALAVAKAAADEFAESRRRESALTFADLLLLTARMLRRRPKARRELGGRYRRILVDEFQDTDPLQAELLFLLASEPVAPPADSPGQGTGDAPGEWTSAMPRPGALFVVGDPKQSIYRFRRADISLYQFVKKRFQSFGDVLHLEANFRSVDKIGILSDGVFDDEDAFPRIGTDEQADFASLRPHRRDQPPGVLATYEVPSSRRHAGMANDEARRIAAEIERRIRSGDRSPEDFMVLTRGRKHLDVYARALEGRNVPVDLSGGDVGAAASDELLAFVLLFKCLADPSNAVLVLGVLAGPLFGVPLDEIARFREAGGRLAINGPPGVAGGRDPRAADGEAGAPTEAAAEEGKDPAAGDEKAREALRTLHEWWRQARREPADVVAERLVRETGLLPVSAAGPLGQLQAGTVVYVLDAVRAAALAGDASLTGGARAMESALRWKEAEPALAPGLKAVRVMNLHRAKGLEADVVFLAAPFGQSERRPSLHVARRAGGQARGTLEICEPRRGWSPPAVIARPLSWEKDSAAEASFEAAERVRLLYVAATRARDELWVARAVKKDAKQARKTEGRSPWASGSKNPWAPLEIWLTEKAEQGGRGAEDAGPVAEARDLEAGGAPEPVQLDPEEDLTPTLERIERSRAQARRPSHRGGSVSQAAKRAVAPEPRDAASDRAPDASRTRRAAASAPATLSFEPPAVGPAPGGREWGEIAHAVLAAAAAGAAGGALAAVAKRELLAKRRAQDPSGEPAELPVLMSLVEAVTASSLWRRALASPERYAEMPFALRETSADGVPSVVHGAIDLVFRDANTGGWVVVDYKTDARDDSEFRKRVPQYRAQVDRYAECWEKLPCWTRDAGGAVQERVLVFAAQGRAESW